ncbi:MULTISPECIES: hypothetical protein [Clostridium]|uniref:Uncharacterized protein n=2 Tax=Clostridium TaxID=1485 RepID=A0A151APQ6_9CLOT|nr:MULTISPECIES: hypothetical protein [Clostridium]KYH29618.1 hypothetical protein CLCOL_08490 [Clostridium colicanis DSM 13634]MBE6043922.1 hypothetical protein [Clostridium thermopalmarium]PRR72069.1 hypothetical protein CPAL_15560 [Clostridium thermopalmarium DSM 5974]PVZ23722.1 hypothetical protein LX19_01431 [Clostridium thermopalmarium DSM 5974]
MSIKKIIRGILRLDDGVKEKDRIENVKAYIKQKLREKGFKNNQIEIDFSDIYTDEEVIKAAEELGFGLERGEKDGVWWLFRY